MGLAEALMHPRLGSNDRLDKIAGLLDWSAVERAMKGLRTGDRGAPPYAPLTMLKALLVQQWYGLSDPELEEALSDRLSFRRFVGLGLSDGTPDHSTLWRFREALKAQGLDEAVFAEVERQLMGRGVSVRRGTMIDASLISAAAAKPRGETSTAASDPDAAFGHNASTRRTTFGYKAHIAVDLESGLIRRCLLTPANVTDTEPADQLVCGDEQAVYADRAYDSKARRRWLKSLGIKDRLMHRANKHHPRVSGWRQKRNRLIAGVRCRVETAFAVLKRHYGFDRCRFFNLARNEADLRLACMAMNLRRALTVA
jgi:IS5 family transposase